MGAFSLCDLLFHFSFAIIIFLKLSVLCTSVVNHLYRIHVKVLSRQKKERQQANNEANLFSTFAPDLKTK